MGDRQQCTQRTKVLNKYQNINPVALFEVLVVKEVLNSNSVYSNLHDF